MNKRLSEIKAIKKAMLEATKIDIKPEDDAVEVAKTQPILQLLLACEIEVITETLDNFKAAGACFVVSCRVGAGCRVVWCFGVECGLVWCVVWWFAV